MAKVAIIGGAGYLGSHLAREAREAGHMVRIYDSLIYEQSSKGVEVGDTRSIELLENFFRLSPPDIVFHFAELSSVYSCEHNPRLTEEVNYQASKSVIDLCSQFNIPIVYNSSSSVYNPGDLYTKYKLLMEDYCKDKNVMIFRPATVFGLAPRFRIELLPNHFTYIAVNKGYIPVTDDGNYRSFIDIKDLTSAYLKVVKKGITCGIYDIGSLNMTKLDMAIAIAEVVPCEVRKVTKIYDKRNLKTDSSKFMAEYEWKPQAYFVETIKEIADFTKGITDFNTILNMPLANWEKLCE